MAKIPPAVQWVLIAAVLVAGLLLPRWLKSRSEEAVPQGSAEVDLRIPVRVETLTAARLEERLTATGSVLANEWVEIVSEIAGKVEAILFQEGAPVSAGTVLVPPLCRPNATGHVTDSSVSSARRPVGASCSRTACSARRSTTSRSES